ncbi:hypothetical protein F2Q68_00027258 [Brassica cretica]|uniref:Leucine-rich repeat-containing N-terminal plant-type domain-containing protein n=1 Tax=Brassica cretica TaxID=69181 RepID=A0A8S9I8W9_BRACR|nr:hypothetical protein F2Q68_00027258 [Brassica cretica]
MAFLKISNNKIKGQVPSWLWTLPKLWYVDLSNNNFIGMERSIKHGLSSNIVTLDISNNEIKGQVLGCYQVCRLWISPTTILLDLKDLRNMGLSPELQILDISNNKIKGQVPGWLWTLPSLTSRNNFTGHIPSLVCELRSLIILDLSVNDFNGSIPHCLQNLKKSLSYLNPRHNNLSGRLPGNVIESLKSIDVGYNQLVGKLPRSLMNFSSLEVLNVESNRINDVFPLWLSSLQNLQILILRSNEFNGPIYQASFSKLQIVDISYNQFSGTLPSDYFVGWSAMSSLGTHKDQSAEKYMGDESSGYYQDSIVLKNKGREIEIVRILKVLTALDFSENRFEGEIPESVGLLKELRSLSMSNNAFSGHIPSSMGNLTSLESLDVSQNKLSGEIPQELGTLSFLSYMNFSNNQLAGLVPGGTQFRTQSCSSFANNSGLFGPALDEACSDIRNPPPQQYKTPEVEEKEEEMFSWIAAAIGFGPGIAFGLTIGYILVSHKPEWFRNPFGRNKRRSTTTR